MKMVNPQCGEHKLDEYIGFINRDNLPWEMFTKDLVYFVFKNKYDELYIRGDDKQKWYSHELGVALESLLEE